MADNNTHCVHNNWHFGRMAKVPTTTATAKADDEGLGSLKGHVHATARGTQASNCTKTTKAMAKCVGWVCGNEM